MFPCVLLTAAAVALTPPTPPKLDRYGDPLPPGAIARYGTTRYWAPGEVQGVSISPSGKRFALLLGKERTQVVVLDSRTGHRLGELTVPESVFAVVLLDDSAVALATITGVAIWTPGQDPEPLDAELLPPKEKSYSYSFAASADGKLWVIEGQDTVHLIDATTRKRVRALAPPELDTAHGFDFSADGTHMVGPRRGGLSVWHVASGKRVRSFLIAQKERNFTLSPSGDRLYAEQDGKLCCHTLDSDEPDPNFTPFDLGGETVLELRPSADGADVCVLTGTGTVFRLDAKTGKKLDTWTRPGVAESADHKMRLARDGRTVVGPRNGRVMAWDAERAAPPCRFLRPHTGLGFSADGKTIRSTAKDGEYHTWDAATGREAKDPAKPHGDVWVLDWDATTERAVYQADGSTVVLCDTRNGRELARLDVPVASNQRAAVLVHGDRDRWITQDVAAGATLRNLRTGKPERKFDYSVGDGKWLLSGDGRTALTMHGTPTILSETASGKVRSLNVASGTDAALTPDGQHAWADGSNDLTLIDLTEGKERVRLIASHYGDLRRIAVSPDGKRVAAGFGSKGNPVVVWDTGAKEVVAEFYGHLGPVTAVAFAPDGKRLASAGEDGVCYVWDLTNPVRARKPPDAEPAQLPRFRSAADAVKALRSDDGEAAFAALSYLLDHPKEAVPALATAFPPVPAVSDAKFAQLLRELGDEEYKTRQAAEKQLEKIGLVAEAALRAELEKPRSEQVRETTERLLMKLNAVELSGDRLAAVRAVEAAERLGTPEAVKLLDVWATGAGAATLTTEAKAALSRLRKAK